MVSKYYIKREALSPQVLRIREYPNPMCFEVENGRVTRQILVIDDGRVLGEELGPKANEMSWSLVENEIPNDNLESEGVERLSKMSKNEFIELWNDAVIKVIEASL